MLKYDKLKDLETEEKYFDFHCPYCNADGNKKGIFDITPIDVSFKPDRIDNSDIMNNTVRTYYNRLPTKRKAILDNAREAYKLMFTCNKCNQKFLVYDKIEISDIKKWISKNTEFYLDLRPREK
jgi:transcription elongation factor Elf1